MKITRSQLKQLIKEEICRLQEQDSATNTSVDTSPSASSLGASPQIQITRREIGEPEENRRPENLPSSVIDTLNNRVRRTRDIYQGNNGNISGRFELDITFNEEGEPVIELNSDSSRDMARFLGDENNRFHKLLRLDIRRALESGILDASSAYNSYVAVF
jgi:hypothetical protein